MKNPLISAPRNAVEGSGQVNIDISQQEGGRYMLKRALIAMSVIVLLAGISSAADWCYEYQKNRDTADKAIEACTGAIKSGRYAGWERATRYLDRGNAYKAKGDYDRAVADYNKAIQIDPKYAFPYNNRGNVYLLKGNDDRAITDYNKAIEIDPKYARAYYNRGNIYAAKGDYDRAIADYNKAVEIDPKYASPYYGRACLEAARGNKEEACNWLHKSIEEGYSNWEDIKKDKNLDSIRNTDCYKSIMSGK
jgi:tetratricopeptide (TPR) repeat protein